MKKIISFFICLCMMLPMCPVYAENDETTLHESYRILNGMGLISKPASDKFSRGEFARLIYDIKHYADKIEENDSWSDSFFSRLEEEAQLIPDEGKKFTLFGDVDINDENTGAIMELVNIGIINGVSDSEFRPEQNVKKIEVVKTVLNLMGYAKLCYLNGAYPDGYYSVAESLGLCDGLEGDWQTEATVADTARIIYNAFDIKLMKLSYSNGDVVLKADETDTLLTKIMRVDYIRGVISDNGITSLYGKSDVGKGNIICADRTFYNAGSNASVYDCLGYSVKLFFYNGGDMENNVIYAEPLKKNKVLTIDAVDFIEYDSNTLDYASGNTKKKAKIEKGAAVIYNGLAVTSIPKDIFDFDNGNITLIAPDGGKYETVLIKSYISMYVGSVDTKNNIIYNRAYSIKNDNYKPSISVDDAYENRTLIIKDSRGEIVGMDSIAPGNVIDIAKNEDVAEIIISGEKVEKFKISGEAKDDNHIIYSADAEYEIDRAFEDAQNATEYALGESVTLYLNSFNKVVWVEKSTDYPFDVGYMIRPIYDDEANDGEGACIIKLIDTDGKSIRYNCAPKVRFGDSKTPNSANYKKLKANEVYKYLQSVSQGVIGYRLDENKNIDTIEIPLEERGGENRLQLIYDSGDESIIYKNDAGGKFKDYTWTDNNTMVFTTPVSAADKYDENKYNCVSKELLFKSDGYYSIVSYGTCAEGIRAEYMAMKKEVKSTLQFRDVDQQYFVVTNVCEGLDENDEEAVEISGYRTSGYKGQNIGLAEMTLYAKNDAKKNASGEYVNPALFATATVDLANENPKYYKVKKGDIIRYTYESEDIYPTGIEILYRADMEGDYGGARGALLGVKEYAQNNAQPYNFFAFKDNAGTVTTDVNDYNTYGRVIYSWLYDINREIGTITSRDLSIMNFAHDMGVVTYVPIQTGATRVTVNYDKKSVSASLTAVGDYKTYKDCGGSCSKIITISMNGWTTFTFVINGEM